MRLSHTMRDKFASRWRMLVAVAVQILFCSRGPSTIGGLVVAVVVWEPIKCVFWRWPSAHIEQKVFERIAPPVTDTDAPSPISIPSFGVRVRTALDHCRPCPVFRGSVSQRGFAVLIPSSSTTTTVCVTASQIAGLDEATIPAITQASPTSISANMTGEFYRNKTPEAHSFEVYRSRHMSILSPARYMWERTA